MSKKCLNRQLAVGLLLAVTSVCVALLALEITVRLLLPRPYTELTGKPPLFIDQDLIFECSSNSGWISRPYYEGILELPGSRASVNLNSRGMHDTEHLTGEVTDSFRVLMLGDSFVHAVQVNEDAASHQVLEHYLNQRKINPSKHYEVISSAVSGWGTGQQLVHYREQGRHFHPDVVLLMFYIGNDFQDNLPGHVSTIGGFSYYR